MLAGRSRGVRTGRGAASRGTLRPEREAQMSGAIQYVEGDATAPIERELLAQGVDVTVYDWS